MLQELDGLLGHAFGLIHLFGVAATGKCDRLTVALAGSSLPAAALAAVERLQPLDHTEAQDRVSPTLKAPASVDTAWKQLLGASFRPRCGSHLPPNPAHRPNCLLIAPQASRLSRHLVAWLSSLKHTGLACAAAAGLPEQLVQQLRGAGVQLQERIKGMGGQEQLAIFSSSTMRQVLSNAAELAALM